MEACMRSSVGRQLATLHNDKAEIGNVYQVLICWDVATVCRVLVSRQELKCLLWGPQRQSCVTVPSQRQIGPVIEWHRVRSPAGFLGTAADRAIGSDVFSFLLAHSRSGALDRQVRSAKLTVEKRWNCSFIDWIPQSFKQRFRASKWGDAGPCTLGLFFIRAEFVHPFFLSASCTRPVELVSPISCLLSLVDAAFVSRITSAVTCSRASRPV